MASSMQDPDDNGVISGINVTPLVDISLVLLIIFIVTASFILRSALPMELPRAKTAEETTVGLLTIAIAKKGDLFINAKPATLADLPAEVNQARARLKSTDQKLSAFISADIGAQYGRFAEVVDRLRLLGVSDIAMDTQPVDLEEQLK